MIDQEKLDAVVRHVLSMDSDEDTSVSDVIVESLFRWQRKLNGESVDLDCRMCLPMFLSLCVNSSSHAQKTPTLYSKLRSLVMIAKVEMAMD